MDNEINKIKSIEIKSLWGRYDLKWDLNPDVNILSGINGSGKSTILESVAEFLKSDKISEKCYLNIKKVEVSFYDREDAVYEHFMINDTIGEIFEKANTDSRYREILKHKVKPVIGNKIDLSHLVNGWINLSYGSRTDDLNIDFISTFDNEILEVGKRPDENVKSELDRDIFKLQKLYLDYQLNIGKRKDLAVEKEEKPREAVDKIKFPQNRFLDIIDLLFVETGKKIDRTKNEIVFNIGEKEITPYQLSSGEKQILVILLTVLIQDNKPSIMFMDEPEISLHFDWQKKLIGYILELNPNVQIILATHSPALVLEGWRDKVKEVRDLIVFDKLAPKK